MNKNTLRDTEISFFLKPERLGSLQKHYFQTRSTADHIFLYSRPRISKLWHMAKSSLPPVCVSNVLLEHNKTCVYTVYGCFHTKMAELGYNRNSGLQSLTYLLCGPVEKQVTDPCSKQLDRQSGGMEILPWRIISSYLPVSYFSVTQPLFFLRPCSLYEERQSIESQS